MHLVSCRNCHKVYRKDNYEPFVCTRCKHEVNRRIKNSYQISLALCICAFLLYIPAMVYPMMEITKFGVSIESTIIEGVISFIELESYFVAFVVFLASIVIPMVKLLGLVLILFSLKYNIQLTNKKKIRIFNFIESIGKWSMIDIYVIAILASVVQLDEVFNIKGGIAATSFAFVVILTMFAAQKFDTRIIWDER